MSLHHLFENNRQWVQEIVQRDPDFFKRLHAQQKPQYLWIGCSDSRIHANEVTGLAPGEIFVHRNVANILVHSDLNALSVLQFGVELLQVKHIIVCGHTSCAGVEAALINTRVGLADNWLRHVQDVQQKHKDRLSDIANVDALTELNVLEQVVNVAQTTIVQDAWARGQSLVVHGWCYQTQTGYLKDLGLSVSAPKEIHTQYQRAIQGLIS